MSINEATRRVRVAYVGIDSNNIPAMKVALEYRHGNDLVVSFLQRKLYPGDLINAKTMAKSLLRDGKVQEIKEMESII